LPTQLPSLFVAPHNLLFANHFFWQCNGTDTASFSFDVAPSNLLLLAIALLFVNAMLPRTQILFLCCCGKLPSLHELLLLLLMQHHQKSFLLFCHGAKLPSPFAIALLFVNAILPTQHPSICHFAKQPSLCKLLLFC